MNSSGYSFFHAMTSNSFLGPHTDHTVDMNGKSYHVLNIIIYASKEWDANFGGGTTIHDKKGKIFTDVEFKPNRALIFLHSPISIHGTQRISNCADKTKNMKIKAKRKVTRIPPEDSFICFISPRYSSLVLFLFSNSAAIDSIALTASAKVLLGDKSEVIVIDFAVL